MELFAPDALAALGQVIIADLALAGDNAIVIGLAAAGLPKDLRAKAILFGIVAATVMRIGFALLTTQLLEVTGLLFAGGILLLWVCWKMWRELSSPHTEETAGVEALANADLNADGQIAAGAPRKTFAQAATQIVIADVSMSLDNVLAVAGAAREHPGILIVGLIFAVALMGIAANIIAKYIERYRWIAWFGLAVIIYVAGKMIYEGWGEVAPVAMRFMG